MRRRKRVPSSPQVKRSQSSTSVTTTRVRNVHKQTDVCHSHYSVYILLNLWRHSLLDKVTKYSSFSRTIVESAQNIAKFWNWSNIGAWQESYWVTMKLLSHLNWIINFLLGLPQKVVLVLQLCLKFIFYEDYRFWVLQHELKEPFIDHQNINTTGQFSDKKS